MGALPVAELPADTPSAAARSAAPSDAGLSVADLSFTDLSVADLLHELRGPVAALRALLEEAALDIRRTDVPDLLDRVLPSVDRAEEIVAGLRALTRREPYDGPYDGAHDCRSGESCPGPCSDPCRDC
ncbi:hypothetical protein JOL79_09960 [Microbispora sp. RL4-1S]|uniref:histidine kinase n=1 Tax=Microbispora oryzae TaxID=2806554 RepID=A0A940WEH8_9ACTN|nr:histidine kinase dimerization/phospho-acceptor domain-containing protein [Microbispora oryzae]MBP2704134.1 hypothetical protein [Microbispora oryzae]